MYTYICHCFLFFSGTRFEMAPLSETLGGVGTIRPLGSRCGRFGRDPCSVSRVASLLIFVGLGMDTANLRVSTTSPGIVFPRPPGYQVSVSPRGLGLCIPLMQAQKLCAHHARVPGTEVNIRSVFCPLMNTTMSTANTQRG